MSKIDITRDQAIKIIDKLTASSEFDDDWVDLMDGFGLLTKDSRGRDDYPGIGDVLFALGVTSEELENVCM